MYDKIEELESLLIDAKAKKQTIEAEKLTGDNIYKILIYFDKLYKVMNDVERRQLITALISEIQIYEEKQPNGQWLKSITFKLPIINEDLNIGLDNNEQVEKVKAISDALVHFGLKRAHPYPLPGTYGCAGISEKDGHGLKMIRCRSISCDIGTAMSSLLRLPASVH